MRLLYRTLFIRFVGIVSLIVCCLNTKAETISFPSDSISTVTYQMQIEFKKGYVSGICMLVKNDNIIKSSIINEFGVSVMDFTYDLNKKKIKLEYVMSALNKWYMKRILKNDLKKVMHIMQEGGNKYVNKKRKLYYNFSLMPNSKNNAELIE